MSWAIRRPHLILFAYGLATAAAVVGMTRLRQEDDLLAFLPTGDADVAFFREVSRRFGALRVALVGVEARAPGGDVFSAAAVERIQAATGALRNVRGVDHVMPMTSLSDLVAGAAGAEVSPLVPGPPADEAAHRALGAKVLSREQVAGSLVSRDGRAALIMVFLTEAAGSRQVAEELKRVAEAELRPPGGDGAELKVYLGGAPFAAHALYEEAQADVRRLSPIASLVLLLVIVIAFRDPVGVALTVGSVAFAAAAVLGAMGFLGEHFTVASATLP